MTGDRHPSTRDRPSPAAAALPGEGRLTGLWFGLLAGPVAWGVHLLLLYTLSVWVCDHVGMAALHVVSILCLTAALAGAYTGWRNLRALPRPSDAAVTTRRVLALLGLGCGVLFAVIVLLGWFAVFLLSPCPA